MSSLSIRAARWSAPGESAFVKNSWLKSFSTGETGPIPDDRFWPTYSMAISRIAGGIIEMCVGCDRWIAPVIRVDLSGQPHDGRRFCQFCGQANHRPVAHTRIVEPRPNVEIYVAEKNAGGGDRNNLVGWICVERDVSVSRGTKSEQRWPIALHFAFVKTLYRRHGVMSTLLNHVGVDRDVGFLITSQTFIGRKVFGENRAFPYARLNLAPVRRKS